MDIKRIRAGLYRVVAADGSVWLIEEIREDPSYGNAWLWYATSEDGIDALDPFRTLRECKSALGRIA